MSAQFADVIGLERLSPWKRPPPPLHHALTSVSLSIRRGERVGVIGRNGAGKTTLLKLISGAAQPTSGTVEVQGSVQALMQVGVGFHPEFTGLENIKGSLMFSGFSNAERAAAEREIIEFVELGEYLNQPIKTYSLGMQSRLQFACATAIKPEVLIVDEILGAGDAYFGVKSSMRMERLTKSGCTLLLVSHSMQQVIQFCERVIWIDGGRVVADGPSRKIVTDYERFMFDLSKGLKPQSEAVATKPVEPVAATVTAGDVPVGNLNAPPEENNSTSPTSEIPGWYSDQLAGQMSGWKAPATEHADAGEQNASPASAWVNDSRLKIVGTRLLGSDGKLCLSLTRGESAAIEITIEAQDDGNYDCWFVVLIYTDDGKPLIRDVTERNVYTLYKGERRSAKLMYDRLLLGRGKYHASLAVYKNWNPDDRTSANWYQILNRSLDFQVVDPGPHDPSLFAHPSRWAFFGGDASI